MAKDVALTVKDGIGWLTLLRPETRNATDAKLIEAAVAALGTLPDGIGALVLAGDGLACACDLRVVGASTVFVPAFGALGLSPDSGTSFHLTRALGGPAAIAAFLRNRRITSAELAACGLADEVAPDGDVRVTAQRLAEEVAGAAPAALLATRRLIDTAPNRTFDDQLDPEAASIRGLVTTADFAEGVTAFFERRRPEFTGA